MYRFTEVTIIPTIESTGLKEAFDKFKQEFVLDVKDIYDKLTSGMITVENMAKLDSRLAILDPDYVNPSTFKVTFHSGRFLSTVDENLILPEFRDILVRKTTNWEDGMRITFDIENRGGGEKATKGEINMWNLSDGSLEAVKAGAIIELKSGYDFRNDYIMTGVITEVITEREGGDMRTRIKCIGAVSPVLDLPSGPLIMIPGDSFTGRVYTWLSGVFQYTSNPYQNIQYPDIQDYGITVVFIGFEGDRDLDLVTFQSGIIDIVRGGSYAEGLNELKSILGIDWIVINKKLYILDVGEVLPLTVRLSFASGLISFNPTPKKDDDTLEPINEFTVKSILIPDIYPKSLIAIQPKVGEFDISEDKYYAVTEVIYISDGNDHICEFKCVAASDWRTAVDMIERQLDEIEAEVSS